MLTTVNSFVANYTVIYSCIFDISTCTDFYIQYSFYLFPRIECEQELQWLKEAGFDTVVKKYRG